ncbi:DUF1440 domain-containing protein [Chryseobacterium sp. T20]|uniref:DUF1440 domain-containing protein n=1 Tax=Chryseobacterium sp. T20 TaxID=3395375 RepID=UPI0039BD6F71
MTNQTDHTGTSSFQTILLSTLVVALLDTIAATAVFYIWFKMSFVQLFQFIASSLYGQEAFDGSSRKIVTGIIIHLVTSLIIAVVYFYAYPKIRFLSKSPVLSGLLYGLVFWLVMNLLIIPNTHIAPSPFILSLALTSIAWHMVLVGLPAALITRKYYQQ